MSERKDLIYGDVAIQVSNISFSYEKPFKHVSDRDGLIADVISELDLTLYKGETLALSGPNGAGKTTLGKLLMGILKPSSGKIKIFGKDSSTMPLSEIGQKIGYGFQNPERQLFATTVEEEIGFGLTYSGIAKKEVMMITESLLELFQLEYVRDSFALNLSYGEKKRVALAASLALSPQYLILDEPTIGLDPQRIKILNQVLSDLRSKEIGMLLISHNEEFLKENVQRSLIMEGGRIIHDKHA